MSSFRIIENAGDYVNCEVVMDSGELVVLPVYGEGRKTLTGIEEQLDWKIADLMSVADVASEVRDAIRDKTVMVMQAKALEVNGVSVDQ